MMMLPGYSSALPQESTPPPPHSPNSILALYKVKVTSLLTVPTDTGHGLLQATRK